MTIISVADSKIQVVIGCFDVENMSLHARISNMVDLKYSVWKRSLWKRDKSKKPGKDLISILSWMLSDAIHIK